MSRLEKVVLFSSITVFVAYILFCIITSFPMLQYYKKYELSNDAVNNDIESVIFTREGTMIITDKSGYTSVSGYYYTENVVYLEKAIRFAGIKDSFSFVLQEEPYWKFEIKARRTAFTVVTIAVCVFLLTIPIPVAFLKITKKKQNK